MYLCNIPRVETVEIELRFDMTALIVHLHGIDLLHGKRDDKKGKVIALNKIEFLHISM